MAETDVDYDLLDMSSEPIGEAPPEPAPIEAAPTEPAPVASTPLTPAEPPPIEPADFASLTPREQALIAHMERITGEQLDLAKVVPTAPQDVPAPIIEHNFLEGMDLDEVLSTPENFNKLLVAVFNRGIQEASQRTLSTASAQFRELVASEVASHTAMVENVRQFYETNPDLQSVKRTVATAANEIAVANPELTIEQVFDQAATKTRALLGLRKPTTPKETNGVSPAFVKSKSRQRGLDEPQLTGIVKEIDDLLT